MMNYIYKSIYDTVKVGDVDRFKSNGRPVTNVKDGETVTVVGFTNKRERVKVTNGTITFEARYNQLKKVDEAVRKKKKDWGYLRFYT